MDCDDIAHPDRLRLQVERLEAEPGLVALGSDCVLIDAKGAPVGKGRYPRDDAACRRHLALASPFCHPAVTMRADALDRAGGYRARFAAAEDVDLWFRLSRFGRLANLPRPLLSYRVHTGGLSAWNGHENACAAALAGIESRHGADAVEAALEAPSGSEWRIRETRLTARHRLSARGAYLRAATLNGHLLRDPLLVPLLLASARDLATAEQRGALAFTLTRAAALCVRSGRRGDAARLAAKAVRHCPGDALADILRTTLRDRLP